MGCPERGVLDGRFSTGSKLLEPNGIGVGAAELSLVRFEPVGTGLPRTGRSRQTLLDRLEAARTERDRDGGRQNSASFSSSLLGPDFPERGVLDGRFSTGSKLLEPNGIGVGGRQNSAPFGSSLSRTTRHRRA
jgi:hypothetical protein